MEPSSNNIENTNSNRQNLNQEFDLSLLINIVRKNVIWFITFAVLNSLGYIIYLRYTQPLYSASASLQISQEDRANQILEVDKMYGSNDISAQIALIKSKEFLRRVLSDLPLEESYFVEGKFLNNENYLSSPFSVKYAIKDSSILGQSIYIDFLSQKKALLTVNNVEYDIGIGIVNKLLPLNIEVIVGNYKAIDATKNLVNQNRYFFTINDINSLINLYSKRISVKILNLSAKTVEVSFQDHNARKTADVSQALAEGYIKYDVEKRRESAENVLNYINNQLADVYGTLQSSEGSIQQFKKDNKLSKSDGFTTIYLERLGGLEQELVTLEMENKILQEIEKTIIIEGNDIDVYSLLPLLVGTQFEASISNLINNLHSLLIKKEELLYDVKLSSETIKSLDYQIGIQKKILIQSIKSFIVKLENRMINVQSKAEEFENSFLEIPTKELEFARLERIFAINEQFYELLLQKRTEYQISKAGFVPNNTILERSFIPSVPVSPNKQIALVASILISILLSLFLVIIKYLMHNTLSSTDDILKTSSTNLSALGLVPKYKRDIPISQLVVDRNPKSMIAESFRALRSNMQFISNTPGPKIAAVTSTVSGEGKTFIAINLAGIIAFTGKKVVIIDLDMRKPKIHIGFNSDNEIGMSTLLINKNSIDDCIKHSELEGLDF
ncbi:Wzz/FepE/Etk N-terminal domain-containing protein, partial [bacterium]|nr:Wzz/FepE/Etk N-terminal domain-containing protein [bacterium]